MLKRSGLLCLITALLGAICAAKVDFAATYYISSAHGNDSNDGLSPALPWQSVKRAKWMTLQPGDTVLLERGSVWNEEIDIVSSGTPSQPIAIGAYGEGTKPLLLGTRNGSWSASHDGIHVLGQSYIDIRDVAVAYAVYGFLFDAGASHDTVDSVEASFCQYDGVGFQDPNSIGNQAINTVSHDNGRSGVLFWDGANGGTVTGGTYYNNAAKYGSGVEFAQSGDGVATGVIAYGNFYGVKAYGDRASNIKLHDNRVYANSSFGIDVDGSGAGVVVEKNDVYENGSHGIAVEGVAAGTIIRYNITRRNGHPTRAGIMLDGSTNAQVYYNVLYAEAIGIWAFGAHSPLISNNTVFSSDTCFGIENGASGVVLENNISSSCNDASLYLARDSDRELVSDYNDWDSTTGSAVLFLGNDDYELAAWRLATSLDAHSIDGDPQFLDVQQVDFRPGPSSPVIGAGTNLGLGISQDIAGHTVPLSGPVDIGAFQSIADQTSNTPATPAQPSVPK